MTALKRHAAPVALVLVLLSVWIGPVARDPFHVIPGTAVGDNVAFLWNTWWLRYALDNGIPPLWTSMLFAPWGSSLALHTHTLLPSLFAALLVPLTSGSTLAATNVVVILQLLLNFIVTYALALHVTRERGPAAIAACIFGCSPFVGAHLVGHFNLIGAWVLPLAALVAIRLLERPTLTRMAVAGLALGAVPYVDYYYSVYAGILVVSLLVVRSSQLSIGSRRLSNWQRWALAGIAAVLIVDVAALAVAVRGGRTLSLGAAVVSIRGTDNPIAIGFLLGIVAAGVIYVPRVRWVFDVSRLRADLKALLPACLMAGLVSAPVVAATAGVWLRGDYSSQRYLWRSAPAGVDLLTLLLGNPGSLLTGHVTRRWYGALAIDPVEQVAWLGPAVIALGYMAWRNARDQAYVKYWFVVGLLFGVWAVGPYIVAGGRTLWVLLPATLVRYVPVVANARIPARAMVVVYLAAGMLAATGWQSLRRQSKTVVGSLLLAVLAIDYWPGPAPVVRLDHPAVYDALSREPEHGIVCELPLGIRDGFGEVGQMDMRVMAYQTIHNRPLAGGFVARLAPRVRRAYEDDPAWRVLIDLSSGAPLSSAVLDGATVAARLFDQGVRHLVINRRTASSTLLAYVGSMPLQPVAQDEERTLYRLASSAAVASEALRPPLP